MSARRAGSTPRGREAEYPRQIPKAGWRDILLRTKREIAEDNISIVAAGVAFYGLLALFPALAALVSIYGLVADPSTVESQVSAMSGIVPDAALDIIREQLHSVATGPAGGLGLGAAIGLLVALWSTMSGVKAVIMALNIAYEEEERRSFIAYNLRAFVFALGMILGAIVTLVGVIGLPALISGLQLGSGIEWLVTLARWPILAVIIILGLSVLYRYGPDRNRARWAWVSWGAVAATLLWIVGSIAFSIYVRNFASYNETYGSLGAVVILLMWFYLSAFAILLGAELNAEMEHQTRRDSTVGPAKPMGRRGAYVADHEAEHPS